MYLQGNKKEEMRKRVYRRERERERETEEEGQGKGPES